MNRRCAIVSLSITVLITGGGAASALAGNSASVTQKAAPLLPPASEFSPRVDNPWYPLKPGTSYTYRGVKDGQPARDVMTVTHRTRRIGGVNCVVIEDRLYLSGHLGERTTEWYSQDRQGNVWYFGEDTAELDATGHITSTAGTWRAGIQGARPGVFMFAHPLVGHSAQQEYFKGQAADHFQVLSLHAVAKVPYISSAQAMLTKEWTPLEPGTIDHKLYVRGIGTVLEQTIKGGDERNALISVTHQR
jgi:hypothetical protein